MRPIAALFVGCNGMTANTTIVGTQLATPQNLRVGSILAALETELGLSTSLLDTDIRFGGWDLPTLLSPMDVARRYSILPHQLLSQSVEPSLKQFSHVGRRQDTVEVRDVTPPEHARDAVARIREEIQNFARRSDAAETVVVYVASPGAPLEPALAQASAGDLLEAVENDSPALTSGLIYAIAAITSGAAFVDFTPTPTLDVPGITQLSIDRRIPIAGRDGSTGQTMLKAVLAEMLRIRGLRVAGWYSTNLIGNHDGEVLSRPEHRQIKMEDKRDVLEGILGYAPQDNLVDIQFYGPRGDNKESWDVVDFVGWLDSPMSMRVNWLGRDSILAAPLLIDIVRLMSLALRRGDYGIQPHMDLFFKRPLGGGWRSVEQMYRDLINYLKEATQ